MSDRVSALLGARRFWWEKDADGKRRSPTAGMSALCGDRENHRILLVAELLNEGTV